LHEALAGALPRLDDDVGVFLWCEPAPSTLGMALSIGGAGLRALGGRAALGAVSDLATAAISARQGRRDLVELGRELRARAGQLRAAVPPPLVGLNAPLAASAVHWALGCPELDLDGSPLFGPPAAMCLAPHVAADRQTQREALLLWAARHRERSDAIVLGPATVGPTAPGEARRPRYESPRHLHEDLRDAWALGFADVTVMGGAEAVADANDGLAWLAALGAGPASSITAAAA
jgi:hypothetical protein